MEDVMERLRLLDEGGGLISDINVIIASIELPVRVVKDQTTNKLHVSYSNSLVIPGLHKTRRHHSMNNCAVKFVGYCGYNPQTPSEQAQVSELLEAFDCYPVFLGPTSNSAGFPGLTSSPADTYTRMLNFCQNTLSPVFHSIIDTQTLSAFDYKAWHVYQTINKLWADRVCEIIQDDHDIVWIHDYHLLLVPQLISRRNRKANIGFFLHCPFPSSDMFMCLPVRNEIVRSMLCSDLVGFHFFEYARHFLTVCKRLMGIDYRFNLGGFLSLEYNGRSVHVKIGHVNVQYQGMQQQLKEDVEIQKITVKLRQSHQGKFIFLSIDRCDHLSGIKLKLQAFRYYLQNFAYARGQSHDGASSGQSSVVLIQYAYPPRHINDVTIQLQNELRATADAINREFDGEQVILHTRPIYQKEKWAALRAADCLLDTSIRDGLNLIAFEYIACKGDTPSHIILSEFTGCSSTLTCCQRIHPWQLEDVASKMDFSFSTPPSNCREKWARDVAYLSANSMESWATDFLGDVRRAKKTDNKIYMRCGFASTYRVLSLDENFKPLDIQACVKAYRQTSQKRLLFFDHEGTLAPDRRHIASTLHVTPELSASGARPSPSVREALMKLSADQGNSVYVFSGRPKKALEQWFGDIPGLGLCAEHGYYIRPINAGEWECMAPSEDFVWKEVALKLMQHYVKRTQGSFIENKGSALVFQYRNSDPDFGAWQAKELATYLQEFLLGMPVVVMTGKGYVEARIAGVSKGIACQWVIERAGDGVQFALAIGDDRSDEEMFQVLATLVASGENLMIANTSPKCQRAATASTSPSNGAKSLFGTSQSLNSQSATAAAPPIKTAVYSVTVGKKPSAAHWYLNDTEEVSDLLDALIGQRTIGSFDVFDSDDTPIDFTCF